MKNVRTTHFSIVFSEFFNLWREQFLCGVGDREPAQAKVTVEKTPKRAGATPLFCGQAAQKFGGVAPAFDAPCVGLFSTVENQSKQSFMHALLLRVQKRRDRMAILKSPPKPPKNETLQIRIKEQIRAKLVKYAEFIDSSESYVVSEALKLIFRKDDEFKSWLEDTNQNGDQPQNDGGSLFEIAKKA